MADTSKIQGHWNYGYNLKVTQSGYTFDYSYTWACNFDNVGIRTEGRPCHFTYSCTYPFYDPNNPTVMSHTSLTGEISLDINGYGNLGADGYAGNTATNGTIFIKYYRAASGSYYTLLCDSPTPWGQHHTW